MQDELTRMKNAAEQAAKAASNFEQLMLLYPDLKKRTARWGREFYYSPSVNELCTDYDIRHSCGCCNDSPMYCEAFVETPYGRVHSDPPQLNLGERYDYIGDRPYPNWEKMATDARLPAALIERLRDYFAEQEQKIEDHSEYEDNHE